MMMGYVAKKYALVVTNSIADNVQETALDSKINTNSTVRGLMAPMPKSNMRRR